MRLENSIKKSADKVASLRTEMDSLRNAKIPTQEYEEISKQIDNANSKFDKLLEKQMQMQSQGKTSGSTWEKLNSDMEELGNEIRFAKGELQDLVDTGKAFTVGSETQEFTDLSKKFNQANTELDINNRKMNEYLEKQNNVSSGYKKMGDAAKKSFKGISNALSKASGFLKGFEKKLKEIATKVFGLFRKEADKSSKSTNAFANRLKSLLSGIFIFNMISAAFRNMFNGISAGFNDFFENNATFNSSVAELRASLEQLRNSFAAAFAPIMEVAIPYLQKLIDYLGTAVSYVAQLIAALFGKSTYTRAVKSSGSAISGVASSVDEVTDSAEEAEKALNKMLSPLDKLNVLSSDKSSAVKKPDKGSGGGGGADIGGTLYEEIPVDSYFKDIADRIKGIAEQFFKPLKTAWERQGKFVMDSWKKALDSVKKLVVSIGKDFLTVWNQEETIKIFENLLIILGDIGLIVSNLADRFREAWEENNTGLHILENIRDIIGIVVDYFRQAADFTVEWSKNLNFSPLLQAFERLTDKLSEEDGLVDSLSGTLYDFYTMVLLPLGKWALEEGLPDLLDTLTKIVDEVDWEKLRTNLADLWQSLEPFAETIGEGLILFIEDVGLKLADFVNSQEFSDFLDKVASWMDDVTPQDVADALKNIADALVTLKLAIIGFDVLSPGIKAIGSILTIFSNAKLAKAIQNIGKTKETTGILAQLGTTLSSFGGVSGLMTMDFATIFGAGTAAEIGLTIGTGIIGGIVAAFGGFNFGKFLGEKITGDTELYDNFKFFGEGGFFSEITKDLETTFEALTTMASDFKNNPIIAGLTNALAGPIGAAVLQINAHKEEIAAGWEEFKNGALQATTEAKQNFDEFFSYWGTLFENLGTTISSWWENDVKPWFTKEKWSSLWEEVKIAFSEMWNNIVLWWNESAIGKWWNENVSPWFTKEKWQNLIENVKTAFVNKFNEIWTEVNNIWNNIVESISEAVSEISGLIDGLFPSQKSMKKMSRTIFDSFPSFIPTSTMSLDVPDIPGYATGQVIPPTMKQHLAWLGDNKHETEVVSPLSTMKQAFKDALMESGMYGGGGNTGDIVIEIDGNEVFRVVRKQNQEFIKQTGASAFA